MYDTIKKTKTIQTLQTSNRKNRSNRGNFMYMTAHFPGLVKSLL